MNINEYLKKGNKPPRRSIKKKPEKPRKLVTIDTRGPDGNAFSAASIVARKLRKEGREQEARKVEKNVINAISYESALAILEEYAEIIK